MSDVYIYDHVRTPRGKGKADGALHSVTALKLGAHVLDGLRVKSSFDPSLIEDVIFGCVDPVGEAGGNIARACVLQAGYGKDVPGVQINRFCASGLEAVNLMAAQIASGMKEIGIGGGVESMSRIGMGASGGAWPVDPSLALASYFLPQGISADLIATKYGFSRADVDGFAVTSQKRAALAWESGAFSKSILPVTDINGITLLERDEHMRPTTTLEALSALKPSFAQMGDMAGFDGVALQAHPDIEAITHVHHAGNSSGIVDGAAGVLLGSKAAGKALGLKPRARIKSFVSVGSDLALMLTGPVEAIPKVLSKARMAIKDIDIFEINEAFSAVVLRVMQAFALDPERVNVNGGAIALGHPLGATGAMLLGTALDELERRNKQTALISLCVAAGMGSAAIIERV